MKSITSKAFAPLLVGATLALVTVLPLHAQDRLTTVSGTVVDGRITEETSTMVQIQTRDFGTLRFRKTQIERIERGAAGARAGGAASPGANPFDGSNPFGGGNPFGDPPAATGGTPFGGFNPFAPAPSGAPAAPGRSQVDPTSSVEIDFGRLASEPVGQRRAVSPPEVPPTWDAVLFDIAEGTSVRARVQPGEAEFREFSSPTNLRVGAEVNSEDSTSRIVMKDGRTILRLAPRTAIRIAESNAFSTRVELQRGSLWVEVPAGAARFISTSGPMVLESSGGVFRVVDAIDLGFHVAVIEGEAQVRSTLAQIQTRVTADNMLVVHPNGSMSPAYRVTNSIRREDAQFDEMPAQWWLQRGRLLPDQDNLRQQRQLVSINDLTAHIREVSDAFTRYARDTGHVPTTQDAFSVLRQNVHEVQGWNGPYLDGILPPLDSWGRPMRYVLREGSGNRQVGVVYSRGENAQDNGGDPSGDIPEMILYYQIESVARASN